MWLQGLRSGNYTFRVKSVDAAGNIGAASQPYAFTVDDTLPVPGESGAGWFTGWHRIAVIAGAAAAGVILLVLLLCACCMRRRRLHRLRSEGCAIPSTSVSIFIFPAPDSAQALGHPILVGASWDLNLSSACTDDIMA